MFNWKTGEIRNSVRMESRTWLGMESCLGPYCLNSLCPSIWNIKRNLRELIFHSLSYHISGHNLFYGQRFWGTKEWLIGDAIITRYLRKDNWWRQWKLANLFDHRASWQYLYHSESESNSQLLEKWFLLVYGEYQCPAVRPERPFIWLLPTEV